MKLNRRKFLATSAHVTSFSLISSFLPFTSWAEEVAASDDHFFVLVHGGGAMDATCGLDPQILPRGASASDLFLEYAESDIIKKGALRFAPPCKNFAAHAEDIALINGIVMSSDGGDIGHNAASEYILSGKGNGTAAFLAVELGSATSTGSLGVGSLADGIAQQIPTNIRKEVSVTDLRAVGGGALGSALVDFIDPKTAMGVYVPLNKSSQEFNGHMGNTGQVGTSIQQYLELFAKYTAGQNNFGFSSTDNYRAAAAIASGVSKQVYMASYGFNGQTFDTHQAHIKNQMNAQTGFWDNIADLFRVFKSIPYKDTGESLFSKTTFMICSEFSRTPALTVSVAQGGGKDHNLETNSVVLAGRGVKGNTLIGKSLLITADENKTSIFSGRSRHIGSPFDYESQRPVVFNDPNKLNQYLKTSDIIRPENVAVSMKKIFGLGDRFTGVFDEYQPLAVYKK